MYVCRSLELIPETDDHIFFFDKMNKVYFDYCRLINSDGSPELFKLFVQDYILNQSIYFIIEWILYYKYYQILNALVFLTQK